MIASLLVYPLPKLVKLSPALSKLLPAEDVGEFLDQARAVAPRWSYRVKRRINYGRALRRNAK
jgi:hypothetical protein